jgi:hypothetical protein
MVLRNVILSIGLSTLGVVKMLHGQPARGVRLVAYPQARQDNPRRQIAPEKPIAFSETEAIQGLIAKLASQSVGREKSWRA